jgi:hypothetical protein
VCCTFPLPAPAITGINLTAEKDIFSRISARLKTVSSQRHKFNVLPTRKEAWWYPWICCWLGSIAGLNAVNRRKVWVATQTQIPLPRSSSPWRSHYTDWRIATPDILWIRLCTSHKGFSYECTALAVSCSSRSIYLYCTRLGHWNALSFDFIYQKVARNGHIHIVFHLLNLFCVQMLSWGLLILCTFNFY